MQLLAAVGFEPGDDIQVLYVSTVCDCNPVAKADKEKSAPSKKTERFVGLIRDGMFHLSEGVFKPTSSKRRRTL